MITNFIEALFNFPLPVKQCLWNMRKPQNQGKHKHVVGKSVCEGEATKSNRI